MKTSEFIKKVEALGFRTVMKKYSIGVHDKDGVPLVNVWTERWLDLDTLCNAGVTEELFDLVIEYAKTPIDEREESKKYYLRHKYLNGYGGLNFLNFNKHDNTCLLVSNKCTANYQTEFTQEEIDNFPFELSMSEWELIEVPK